MHITVELLISPSPRQLTFEYSTTMQIVLIFAVLVAAVSALPPIPILERTDIATPSGNYKTSYLTGDGTKVMESGRLIPSLDGKDMTLTKEGTISYTNPDGKTISITYVADENGFRATGDHLPKHVVALPPSFV